MDHSRKTRAPTNFDVSLRATCPTCPTEPTPCISFTPRPCPAVEKAPISKLSSSTNRTKRSRIGSAPLLMATESITPAKRAQKYLTSSPSNSCSTAHPSHSRRALNVELHQGFLPHHSNRTLTSTCALSTTKFRPPSSNTTTSIQRSSMS
jgi:hypothetical protein